MRRGARSARLPGGHKLRGRGRRAVRRQRRRRLPQRPPARCARDRQRPRPRAVPGQRHAPAALRRPAAALREPPLRVAGPDRGPDPQLLQGRQLRRQARGRGVHHLAAPGRHDHPRQGLRRAAHLRRHARRRDVRHGLRRRPGPPLPHGRAAPHRPGAAVVVRRRLRRQPRDGPHAVGDRALHRGRPAVPARRRAAHLRRSRAARAPGPRGLPRGNQRLHSRDPHRPHQAAR